MKKTTILFIDDDVAISSITKRALESSGDFDVTIINDSQFALKTARELKPDIILLDMCMPGFDGGDVHFQLKADPFVKFIPVIFLTSLVSKSEVGINSVVESGGMIMLPKASSVDVLKRCIEERLVGVL